MENKNYFKRDAVVEVQVPVVIEEVEAEVVGKENEEVLIERELPENYY
jgi:hypothetical protein